MNDTKETIRNFVITNYLPGESPANLTDDMPLRTSGILDSLATLRLVGFIEKEYEIELEAYEIADDNFDRIEDIAALIERKRGGRD